MRVITHSSVNWNVHDAAVDVVDHRSSPMMMTNDGVVYSSAHVDDDATYYVVNGPSAGNLIA
jgi:hypothetical protein